MTLVQPPTLSTEEVVAAGLGAQRGRLRAEIAQAARVIAPLWPIDRFIAVNPMHGLTGRPFDEAAALARRWLGADTHPGGADLARALHEGRVCDHEVADAVRRRLPGSTVADLLGHGLDGPPRPAPRTALERADGDRGTALAAAIDAEVGAWCLQLVAGHHDEGGGLWEAWTALAPFHRRLRRLVGRDVRRRLRELPARADDAVNDALLALGVDGPARVDELRGQLARTPGWAGWARWSDEWAAAHDPAPSLATVDLLAVKLTCDALILESLGMLPAPTPPAPTSAAAAAADAVDPGSVILDLLERGYRHDLVRRLSPPPRPAPERVAAQLVFCIDVRSEGLRRHLEDVGPYDTIGFAGFFAVPIRFRPIGSLESVPQAPALIDPEVEVPEQDRTSTGASALVGRRRRQGRLSATVDHVSHGPVSMYAFAEAAGWVLGPRAVASTLAPALASRARPATPATRIAVEAEIGTGFSLEERVLVAESALRTMGLTREFAPLVVLSGHRATTTANPHASSLDCGACAGNPGGANARAAAAILNEAAVRAELAERGIAVPAGTWFVAAEHDTTTDRVELLDLDLLPASHHDAVEALERDLAEAGRRNAAERAATLPGSGRRHPPGVRARDWTQTRPEWGLANNAAFVVASRDLTRGKDLAGRAFLHSYDADADDTGEVLETILTAPMVVGHWINMQYYGSTVAPDVWGAGDKTMHNPVPGVGVLVGAGTDLRPGLPWQSVADEYGPHHEPVRLLTVVAAAPDRIDGVISRNPILRDLFDGEWVHLLAVDPTSPEPWLRRRPGGGWESVNHTDGEAPAP